VARAGSLAALLLCAAPCVAAQTAEPPTAGQKIDSVVVLNDDIFARTEEDDPTAGFLARLANALHIRTRARTIRQTLLLSQGDVFDSARAVESARALRNLGVFRQVGLDTARVDDRLYLLVMTGDGWSTRPQFNFSTAAGDETWQIGVSEENFLGTASEVAVAYRHTPDRNAFDVLYRNPHFIVPRTVLLLRYSDFSDGGARAAWRLGLPFAQTSARAALETSGDVGRGRILLFRDGEPDTARLNQLQYPILHSMRASLRGGLALRATSRDYTRAWMGLTFRREDYAPDTATVIPRSTFATAGAGLEFGHTRLLVVEHFNAYSRREDINLSQILRVGAWVAPRAWGYPTGRAGIAPELFVQGSTMWRGGFLVLRAGGNGVFASDGLDSGRVAASMTFGTQNLPGQTLVLHAEAAVAEKPSPGAEYDFWYDRRSGPRLFGAHAFSGTRLVWVTLEDRILIADDVYGVLGIGIAPFIDWGGIWYPNQSPRTGGNVGFSWRLGPTRATRGDPVEIAVGVRFGAGITSSNRWALTIRRAIRF
jgi:hypothetical protein